MKILEFLQKLYGTQKPTTIKKRTAQLFGIPYPLRAGWLEEHGGREIPMSESENAKRHRDLQQKRTLRAVGIANAKAAKRAKRALASIPKAQQYQRPAVACKSVVGDAFLMSYEWRKLRMEALKLHGARCQCCGATPATGAVMNVDHIKPRRIYPALALDITNLQVLCHECNHGKGNWDMTDWRKRETV